MSAGDSRGQLTDVRPRLIPVARVVRSIGLKGELKLELLTDLSSIFEPGFDVFIGEDRTPATIERFNDHSGGRLKLAGIDSRERAELLRGETIYCEVERAVGLLDGRYFEFQIIGLQVVTTENEILGSVVEIIETGANDVYVVRNESAEILLPATREIVLNIDLDSNTMTVNLIPGLRGDS
jgi:16S rRNA processing protein RimM